MFVWSGKLIYLWHDSRLFYIFIEITIFSEILQFLVKLQFFIMN